MSATLIAAMVPPETNLASWKRSFSPTTISFMRRARSPTSSRERTPWTRASKLPRGDLGGDPLDLDDRAADPERQQDRAGDRHGEADQRPEAQALEHLLDREIGVALALLDQDRPVERPREHERPEHDLAVRPLVGLDADDRRARLAAAGSPRPRSRSSVRSVRLRVEHLVPVGVDDGHERRSG